VCSPCTRRYAPMARRGSSNVSDMQLSFDLWGLEDAVPDDELLAEAGTDERTLDERPVHAGPATGEASGDRPKSTDGVSRRSVPEENGAADERPDGGERDRVRRSDGGILRTWVLDHESGPKVAAHLTGPLGRGSPRTSHCFGHRTRKRSCELSVSVRSTRPLDCPTAGPRDRPTAGPPDLGTARPRDRPTAAPPGGVGVRAA